MLDSLYSTLFRPSETRFSIAATWGLWLLLGIVLALNAAGIIGLEAKGTLALAAAFVLGGLLGWYWLSASIDLLARLLGGQGDVQTTMSAIAQGFWPLLLTAPAIVVKDWVPEFGELVSLAITVWILFALVRAIRQAHSLNWGRSVLCLAATGILSGAALFGLILWPLMILLGT